MSNYLEKAEKLRLSKDKHYNCAQSVLISFSEGLGIDEDTAYKIASGFGSGMKTGDVCGAITGGIMVLGLMGLDSQQNVALLFSEIKKNHEGNITCRDLLALNAEKGKDKSSHCDNMIFEVIRIVEKIKNNQA